MTDEPTPENEQAPEIVHRSTSARGNESGRNKKLAAGLAFGIGSAAIVAALLYAGRAKAKGAKRPPQP